MPASAARRLRFYAACAWKVAVLRRPAPLIYGIAITDRCSMACRGCRVANTGRPDMSWSQVAGAMTSALGRGCRSLYLTGGEPTLWRDGSRGMEDIVTEAYRLGFFHVQVYTNGLQGLRTSADLVWVSMDGLQDAFETRRGPWFPAVERAIRQQEHPRVAVICTIDRHTAAGIGSFLRWVRDTALPVMGVMFYFHTPYYGRDELFLTAEERAPVIDELLSHIRDGLPVLNTRSGLRALRSGHWRRPLELAWVADREGEWPCCRASAAPGNVCEDCGYAVCAELTEAQRLRPSASINSAQTA
ncbi:MAG: radical SAM protein [Rhodospirillaceae bacterium]